MSKHTAGPWINKETAGGHNTEIYTETGGSTIALTYHACSYEENAANANLIAAAPDLLEACKAMIACLEDLTTEDFSRGGEKAEREMMIAAIAKAEGN